jgi:hypothetical protein
MAIVTDNELTLYSGLSASAATIASNLVPIIQDRICLLTNNYFQTDLYVQGNVVFNASAHTIVMSDADFNSENFLASDDILVYNSYRNDGFFTLSSVSGSTLTIISSQSVVDELSGASILISVVKWPKPIKQIAALMVEYDYSVRPKQSANIKSRSLGPWSESYTSGSEDQYGYPTRITDGLIPYRMARIV